MMTVSSSATTAEQTSPPFTTWSQQLADNVDRRAQIEEVLPNGLLCRIRQEVQQAAEDYTAELDRLAATAGLDQPGGGTPPSHCDQPLVATGHQPLVFHPGLMAKNRLLQQLLDTQPQATGLMILIDTDEGHAGQLRYPQATPRLQVATASIATNQPLYLSQTLLPDDHIADVGQEIVSRLEEFGFADAAERTSVVMDHYTRLAGLSAVAANSIVRRLWEGHTTYRELPLSHLCQLPSVQQFLRSQVEQASSLFSLYNGTLSDHRREHRIANPANPFPSLASAGRRLELPFWVITASGPLPSAQRQPLIVDPRSPLRAIPPDALLVPRGMMISAILRLLVSDLFIHGTGGQRYDVCTNAFVSRWQNVALPDFVTASETRHLFADEVQRMEQTRDLSRQLHNSRHRFRQFVNDGHLGGVLQAEAEQLLQQREQLLKHFYAAQNAGESARHWHEQLKAIREQIHQFTERAIVGGADLRLPPPAEQDVLTDRTFPFFFFD